MSEPTWELLGGPGVIGGPIDYIGAWAAGTQYQPGQVVRYGGVDYLAVNPSLGQTPPPAGGFFGAYGTTLPASPVDGQEAILVDSITNPTYQWRFRYNAGSSSAYKWEFVGGAPQLKSSVTIDSVTGGGAWIDDARVTYTGLRAGEYLATYEVYWNAIPATGQNSIGCSGTAGNVAPSSDTVRSFQGTLTLMSVTASARLTITTTLYAKLFAAGTGGQIAFRSFSVLPVRVS